MTEIKNAASDFVKRCFGQALMLLMRDKKLNSISVTDIAAKAGISRMTYYRNFASKEHVLRTYMQILAKDYAESLGGEGAPHRDRDHILQAVQCFKDNLDFVTCLEQEGLSHILLEGISDFLMACKDDAKDNFIRACALQYYAGALYNVCMYWYRSGMEQSEEEVTDAIMYSIKTEQID